MCLEGASSSQEHNYYIAKFFSEAHIDDVLPDDETSQSTSETDDEAAATEDSDSNVGRKLLDRAEATKKVCKTKDRGGKKCIFGSMSYKGKIMNSCTKEGHHSLWCYTGRSGSTKHWAHCEDTAECTQLSMQGLIKKCQQGITEVSPPKFW